MLEFWRGQSQHGTVNFSGTVSQPVSSVTWFAVNLSVQKYHEGGRVCMLHCKEDPINVFPEMRLRAVRGLVPNFHIHVSASDLYISMIGPPILLQQSMSTDRGNIETAHRYVHECGN